MSVVRTLTFALPPVDTLVEEYVLLSPELSKNAADAHSNQHRVVRCARVCTIFITHSSALTCCLHGALVSPTQNLTQILLVMASEMADGVQVTEAYKRMKVSVSVMNVDAHQDCSRFSVRAHRRRLRSSVRYATHS